MDRETDEIDPAALIAAARGGDEQAMERLLAHYRPYLAMLARLSGRPALRGKYDDSDLVQETLLQVHRDLAAFRGSSEPEFTAWMRRIIARISGKHARYHSQQRRDAALERRLEADFSQSSQMLGDALVGANTSPSEKLVQRERAVILARALAELPADYREALVTNRLEGLTIAQTAEKMGRSVDSVQKLLARGLLELRRRLEGHL